MSDHTDATLSLEDIEVAYGAITAVKGISLAVAPGELVALIGSNGAGKSTTLRAISGLLRPRVGRIRYGDTDLTRLPPYRIVARGICHAPEGRQIFGGLTVRENLMLGAVRRPDRRDAGAVGADLDRVFAYFPILRERLGQTGGTLSGGEQQMLALARALMSRPKLLLLDEPSLGLAPTLVDAVFGALGAIRERGVTSLLVEQRAQRTVAFADRTYLIANGELRLTLTPKDADDTTTMVAAYLS